MTNLQQATEQSKRQYYKFNNLDDEKYLRRQDFISDDFTETYL